MKGSGLAPVPPPPPRHSLLPSLLKKTNQSTVFLLSFLSPLKMHSLPPKPLDMAQR